MILAVVVVRKVESHAIDDPYDLNETNDEEVADPEGRDAARALSEHPDDVQVHGHLENDQREYDFKPDPDWNTAAFLGLSPIFAHRNEEAVDYQDYQEEDENNPGDCLEGFFLSISEGKVLTNLVASSSIQEALSLLCLPSIL